MRVSSGHGSCGRWPGASCVSCPRTRMAREFDAKWLRGGAPADEPLVGSADIQALADLCNSFEIIQSMRVAPVTKGVVVQLAVMTLLPVAPLLLTMVSLEEIVTRLLQIM